MRIAVYQRNLETLGGGERYTLDFARWFRDQDHDVDVLAPAGTPLARAQVRLGADVDGLGQVDVDTERPDESASELSAAYDVFVNATHGSAAVSLARRSGVYVCHFPSVWDRVAPIASIEAPGPGGARAWVRAVEGMSFDDAQGLWTDGAGQLIAARAGRASVAVRMRLAARSGSWRGVPGHVEVRVDGEVTGRVRVPPVGSAGLTVRLPVARAASWHRIALVGDRRVERMTGRGLGVHVRDLRLVASGAAPVAPTGAPPQLRSYAHVVANSAFTQDWIARRWGRAAPVVHPAVPPVDVEDGTARTPSIVVVGRFFSGGHSKRQVELVHAFRRLCADGLAGWRLVLVGGVDRFGGDEYLERVQRAAAGLPVDVVVDASRADLERRLREASIVWQASGWGEVPDERPERFEHFGIALVEAMSAGAVPVALGIGGAREIVRDGVDGLLWTERPDEPTRALAADPARLRELSRAARARARAYAPELFAAKAAAALPDL
ncbi:MAG: hypothetical protein QOF76_677 [Solirubrobacteraceae bacterium]|jgi:glycosyltransferase involved in cell wall biosynthesis|nr:hypothetical protein [Solirubrobacteraceae bacterium]